MNVNKVNREPFVVNKNAKSVCVFLLDSQKDYRLCFLGDFRSNMHKTVAFRVQNHLSECR